MKRILFLIIVIGVSLQGQAQDELNTKFKSIPAKESTVKEVIPPKEISKDTNLYKPDSNTNEIAYRRNQYLGGFRTKSFTSTIRYRDAAFVDGDKIKVYLNDKVIEPEVGLDGEFKGFKITLAEGMNKIDFEALNEGFASPNTAQFEVYDDKGAVIYSSQWNVGTGYKATILLLKE
jgi:hypothetical protein